MGFYINGFKKEKRELNGKVQDVNVPQMEDIQVLSHFRLILNEKLNVDFYNFYENGGYSLTTTEEKQTLLSMISDNVFELMKQDSVYLNYYLELVSFVKRCIDQKYDIIIY